MTPARIQLSRRKGFSLQAASLALNGLPAVKVDRTTAWGNPFSVVKGTISGGGEPTRRGYFVSGGFNFSPTREEVQRVSVASFEEWMHQWPQHKLLSAARHALRGKNLACWCALPKLGEPDVCHAAVLLRLVSQEEAP